MDNGILGLFYIRGSYEDKQWYVVQRDNSGIRFCVVMEKSNKIPSLTLGTVYDIETIFTEYKLSTSQVVLSRINRYECF
jgi:hypothetical protein